MDGQPLSAVPSGQPVANALHVDAHDALPVRFVGLGLFQRAFGEQQQAPLAVKVEHLGPQLALAAEAGSEEALRDRCVPATLDACLQDDLILWSQEGREIGFLQRLPQLDLDRPAYL
jgi:hypothetical protein